MLDLYKTKTETIGKVFEKLDAFCINSNCCCDNCPVKKECDIFHNECFDETTDKYVFNYTDKKYCAAKAVNLAIDNANKVTADTSSNIDHPFHYAHGGIECINAMIETQGKEAVMAFCICNAMKYLWRQSTKNGIEDVRKAKWYLDKYIELYDEQPVEPSKIGFNCYVPD